MATTTNSDGGESAVCTSCNLSIKPHVITNQSPDYDEQIIIILDGD